MLREDNLPDARDLRQGAGEPARAARRCRCSSTRRSRSNEDARLTYLHARHHLGRGLRRRVRRGPQARRRCRAGSRSRNTSGHDVSRMRARQLVAGDVNLVDIEEQWWQIWQQRAQHAISAPPALRAPARAAARRLLRLPDQTAHHGRQQPDQAGELPRRRRREGQQGLRADVSTASSRSDEPAVRRSARALLELEGGRPGRAAAERRGARVHARRARPAAVRRREITSATPARAPSWRSRSAMRSTSTVQPTLLQTTADHQAQDRIRHELPRAQRPRRTPMRRHAAPGLACGARTQMLKESIAGRRTRLRQLRLGRARAGQRRNHADVHRCATSW